MTGEKANNDKSLESWIWDAACSIRGAKDAAKYKEFIVAYAQEIGWLFVLRTETEARRGFDPDGVTPEERIRPASLFFGDQEDKGSLRVT